jgi:GMP synthase PP-ATPase subunit
MDINEIMKMVEKSLPDENLFSEVLRDIVKDELKDYLKNILEKNPEIKKGIREAIKKYTDAKLHEIAATTEFSKSFVSLIIASMPEDMKKEILEDLITIFQREISKTVEKTL